MSNPLNENDKLILIYKTYNILQFMSLLLESFLLFCWYRQDSESGTELALDDDFEKLLQAAVEELIVTAFVGKS